MHADGAARRASPGHRDAGSVHRSACLLLTLLAAPQIAGAYPTPPPGTHAVRQAPAKGLFLVADAGMPDPRFRETVILLVEHDAGGTVGLIVNRATGVSVAQALPELEGDGAAEHILFLGGPVGLDRLALLARGTPPPAPSEPVVGDVYLSRSREALAALVEQRSASALRVFAGYAGWAPGQLEAELLQGSWFLTPADAERVFARDPAGVWRELYDRRRRGTVVQRRATPYPGPTAGSLAPGHRDYNWIFDGTHPS